LITTIIPTLCEAHRKVSLLRAIASIHGASSSPVRILVVANGQRYDPALLAELAGRSDLELIRIEEGSQTGAQLAGRRAVQTPFFSFLDDDDEYLPGTLDERAALLLADPRADIALTNGYLCVDGIDEVCYARLDKVPARALFELFQENWLHNCNQLFRTASISVADFENTHPLMEWTWLAFRLIMQGRRVAVSDRLGFRYHDTPGSLSKSGSFLASRVTVYQRMLSLQPDREITRILRQRLCDAWHEVAMDALRRGQRGAAVRAHLHSLSSHWSGLKFLPSSRHLLRVRA